MLHLLMQTTQPTLSASQLYKALQVGIIGAAGYFAKDFSDYWKLPKGTKYDYKPALQHLAVGFLGGFFGALGFHVVLPS
jgi:hypothetical protein